MYKHGRTDGPEAYSVSQLASLAKHCHNISIFSFSFGNVFPSLSQHTIACSIFLHCQFKVRTAKPKLPQNVYIRIKFHLIFAEAYGQNEGWEAGRRAVV